MANKQCEFIKYVGFNTTYHLKLRGKLSKHLKPGFINDFGGYFSVGNNPMIIQSFAVNPATNMPITYSHQAFVDMIGATVGGRVYAKCIEFEPHTFNIVLEMEIE